MAEEEFTEEETPITTKAAAGGLAAGSALLTKKGRKVAGKVLKGAGKGLKPLGKAVKGLSGTELGIIAYGGTDAILRELPQFKKWLSRADRNLDWYFSLPRGKRKQVWTAFVAQRGLAPRGIPSPISKRTPTMAIEAIMAGKRPPELRYPVTDAGFKLFEKIQQREQPKVTGQAPGKAVPIGPGLDEQGRPIPGVVPSEAITDPALKRQAQEIERARGQAATIERIARAAEQVGLDPELFIFEPPPFAALPDTVIRATLNAVARQIGPGRVLEPEELAQVTRVYREHERRHYEQAVRVQEDQARRGWVSSSQRVAAMAQEEFDELMRQTANLDPQTGLPRMILGDEQVAALRTEATNRARRRIQMELEGLGPQPIPPIEEEAELAVRRGVATVAPEETLGAELRAALESFLRAI